MITHAQILRPPRSQPVVRTPSESVRIQKTNVAFLVILPASRTRAHADSLSVDIRRFGRTRVHPYRIALPSDPPSLLPSTYRESCIRKKFKFHPAVTSGEWQMANCEAPSNKITYENEGIHMAKEKGKKEAHFADTVVVVGRAIFQLSKKPKPGDFGNVLFEAYPRMFLLEFSWYLVTAHNT
ncbi:hypothetical protein BDN70DRAFT_921749 [Pholiota conissans]|uniref:Uncharacterized protein n=1 Tax=Pholiota conissans TaxID=109636 RepID=A0A9P6CTQ3_9AGAR|nr:hypothetical protein BDN70DRAFT_921749 [Pholiota conissans]